MDLRGLPATDLKLLHVPLVHQVRWQRLDLSGADLSNLFLVRGGAFEDCRFDRATCRSWSLFGGAVRSSSFVGADLRGAMMGKDTTWVDVDFTRASLSGTNSERTRFERCRFDHSKLRRRIFETDYLIRCSFAGLVDDCQFGGPDSPHDLLQGVDFSAATLRDPRFWGQNLTGLIPPSSADHVVVRHARCVLQRMLAELAADDHPLKWLDAIFDVIYRELGPKQTLLITNLADMSLDETVEGGKAAGEALRRHEAACGTSATAQERS